MVTCAAYYSISQVGVLRYGGADAEAADEQAEVVSKELLQRASLLLRVETTLARYELAAKKLGDEIHNDFSNFSILLLKYAELCKTAFENSDARFMYWMEEASRALP